MAKILPRMTCEAFASTGEDAAASKTLYVQGGYGQLLTDANKQAFVTNKRYTYNQQHAQAIREADADTYAFDCICLVKAILNGWRKGSTKESGYLHVTNPVKDATPETYITDYCTDVHSIQRKNGKPVADDIPRGAFLYMPGHAGIYVGLGKVSESCPSKNGVKITDLSYQKWTKWGLLKYVDYSLLTASIDEFACELLLGGIKATALPAYGKVPENVIQRMNDITAHRVPVPAEYHDRVCMKMGLTWTGQDELIWSNQGELTPGRAVLLSNTPLYSSPTAATTTERRSGIYYVCNLGELNGRIAVTTAPQYASDVSRLSGYVAVKELPGR